MYRPEKISFDKVLYGKVNTIFKFGYFGVFVTFFFFALLAKLNFTLTPLLFLMIPLYIIMLVIGTHKLMKGYNVVFGINSQGVYSSYGGWIDWKDIKDVHVKKSCFIVPISGLKKQDCIYVTVKRNSKEKNVRLLYKSLVDEPLQEIANLIKEYIEKYGKK